MVGNNNQVEIKFETSYGKPILVKKIYAWFTSAFQTPFNEEIKEAVNFGSSQIDEKMYPDVPFGRNNCGGDYQLFAPAGMVMKMGPFDYSELPNNLPHMSVISGRPVPCGGTAVFQFNPSTDYMGDWRDAVSTVGVIDFALLEDEDNQVINGLVWGGHNFFVPTLVCERPDLTLFRPTFNGIRPTVNTQTILTDPILRFYAMLEYEEQITMM